MFPAATCLFCLALVGANNIDSNGLPTSSEMTVEEMQDWPKVPTYTIPTRAFKIPFRTGGNVEQVVLYISTDRGRTWREYAKARPAAKSFYISTQHDGEYWFIAQTVDRNNSRSPASIRKIAPDLKVKVDTRAKP
jgi:hypothetical protein